MIVQMLGGWLAHVRRDPTRTVRPVPNTSHRLFGALILVLGWAQMVLGVRDHPTCAAWGKWTGIGLYFAVIMVIFGRSEWLLWRRDSAQVPAETSSL